MAKLSGCLIIDIATEHNSNNNNNNNNTGLLWLMSKDELFLQGFMCAEQDYI